MFYYQFFQPEYFSLNTKEINIDLMSIPLTAEIAITKSKEASRNRAMASLGSVKIVLVDA